MAVRCNANFRPRVMTPACSVRNCFGVSLNTIFASQFYVMLSDEEKAFLQYWETNREKEKKTWRQLLIGLPLGLIFTLPILINFLSGWHKRATMEANAEASPGVLISAVLIIAVFFAIFNKRHKWDLNEQRYSELKSKEKKSDYVGE